MTPSLVERVRGKSITTQEASITTATVEIKTVTVSGKQLTLSTFRQIKDEPIIDEEALELRGTPWGVINYFWKHCHHFHNSPHVHVLWQKGDELRVAGVPRYLHEDDNEDYADLLRMRSSCQRERIMDLLSTGHHLGPGFTFDLRRRTVTVKLKTGESYPLSDIPDECFWLQEDRWNGYSPLSGRMRAEAIAELSSKRTMDPETLVALTQQAYDNVESYRQRWDRLQQELAKLDHLFIAV